MGNLYERVRSQKGNPENGIEDPLRRLAPARRVVIRGSLAHTLLSHGSSKRNDEE
jgi:hypothetical protein